MNRKKVIWLAVLLAALLAIGGWALLRRNVADEEIDETLNLLYNASFEEVDEDGAPAGWLEGKWYWDSGVSMLSLSDDAYTGEHSIMVYSAGENDARYTQTIAVAPNSWYRLSCMVKAEGCDEARNGAGVSIEDTFVSSEYVYDTDGDWVKLTLYGKTGADQNYITVMARVGGYGSLNVGRAWFDDMELVRLKNAPTDAAWVSFATNPPSSASDVSEEPADGQAAIVATFVAAMLLAALLGYGMKRKQDARAAKWALWCGAAIGLAARLICATAIRGYEVDMNCFEGWAARMVEYGASGFYNAGWCDYPPGYMLVLYVLGGLRSLFGWTVDGPAVWLLFKSAPILCDMLIGGLIWKVAKKRLGDWPAALMAAFYLVNPATVLNSAAWGQVDAVLTLLLALAVCGAVSGRWLGALVVYAAAVLVKPQALMFGPIGLLAMIVEVWRGADRRKALAEMGKGVAAALALMLAVITPFSLGQGQNPFTWAWSLYGETLSSYPYITVNACNLYSLLGKNWVALTDAGWLNGMAWGMYALAFGYAFFLYIRANKRENLFLTCAVMLTWVFAFGAKMHERYLFPAIALLLIAYAMHKDVRLLIAAALTALGQFLNGALVLANEHLQADQAMLNHMAALMNIAAALVTAWTGWDVCVRGMTLILRNAAPRETETGAEKKRFPIQAGDWRLGLKRVDYILMAALTLAYSVVAFANLGSTQAPETAWTSTLAGETVVFDLGETRTFHMTYYGGICNSSFTVSLSEDGEVWTEEQLAVYDQGEIFRWLWFSPSERKDNGDFMQLASGYPMQTARYVSVKAEKAGLVLHEFGFLDENGETLPIESVVSYGGDGERTQNPALLIDEQETVPPYPSYYNSTYFDEIYHARTAYEHLHGMRPYETTHPPLGKVLIMLGVKLFGMTPFGWRFTGTLLGVLMLPIMYLLAKQLLKKTEYAFGAMFLLTFDCMHFTQTRISTIDTYGVFFILLMYLFMFRYCQMNFFVDDFKKTLIPLGLCGVSMGLGIASKWICIYAAVGLAILFFATMIRRYLEYRDAKATGDGGAAAEKARERFVRYFWGTCAFCVVFFVVIPLLIYYFSYYWYMKPLGGLSIKRVWDAQLSMFNYHKGLTNDTHFFRSPWYEWPLIIKPMWYYSGTEFMENGVVSSISCMGNPAVWWVGAAAMVCTIVRLCTHRADRIDWFIVLGFAAQYVPWMLVPRSTFIYHYFASVPFIILATVATYRRMDAANFRWRKPLAIGVMAAAVVLFIGFYPLMSGTPVLRSYANYLRWFNWYNF